MNEHWNEFDIDLDRLARSQTRLTVVTDKIAAQSQAQRSEGRLQREAVSLQAEIDQLELDIWNCNQPG